jgi:hypothetical protein
MDYGLFFLESVSVYFISIKIDAADRFSFRLAWAIPKGISLLLLLLYYIFLRVFFLVENVFRAVGTDK